MGRGGAGRGGAGVGGWWEAAALSVMFMQECTVFNATEKNYRHTPLQCKETSSTDLPHFNATGIPHFNATGTSNTGLPHFNATGTSNTGLPHFIATGTSNTDLPHFNATGTSNTDLPQLINDADEEGEGIACQLLASIPRVVKLVETVQQLVYQVTRRDEGAIGRQERLLVDELCKGKGEHRVSGMVKLMEV